MSDFLLISDLHLDNFDRFGEMDAEGVSTRLRTKLTILGEILSSVHSPTNETEVVICGDLTEQKDRHPGVVLNLLYDMLAQYPIPIHIVLGQHDFANRRWPSVLPARHIPHIHVYNNPSILSNRWSNVPDSRHRPHWVIPWQSDLEGFEQAIARVPAGAIVFMHQLVAGSKIGDYTFPDGLPLELFDRFTMVFSGDNHHAQQIGNVIYIGSPWQNNFGEEGYEPRVIRVNTERLPSGFQESTHSLPEVYKSIPTHGICSSLVPRYQTLDIDADSIGAVSLHPMTKYLKLRITCTPEQHCGFNQTRGRAELKEMYGLFGVEFEFDFIHQERKVVVAEGEAVETAVRNYIDNCTPEELGGLDKDEVVAVGGSFL